MLVCNRILQVLVVYKSLDLVLPGGQSCGFGELSASGSYFGLLFWIVGRRVLGDN